MSIKPQENTGQVPTPALHRAGPGPRFRRRSRRGSPAGRGGINSWTWLFYLGRRLLSAFLMDYGVAPPQARDKPDFW